MWKWIINILRLPKRTALQVKRVVQPTETFMFTTMTYYPPGSLVGREYVAEDGVIGTIIANTELTMTVKW